ncbi:uncharacterized protein LOC133927693 [Phragmites australis]|uniref:uncharacterized protein LOC133927693 n=1 Tax=Phragmites australis TaxID=29695 RepID=UPI002D76B364|nr:uncharacterized protein LOC133927693 [Phragmites australis]
MPFGLRNAGATFSCLVHKVLQQQFSRNVKAYLALCVDPGRVALQATLPEFDTQGLVNRPGHRNPGTIQIPGVDEETYGAPRTSGRDATGGRPQASGRDAAGGRTQTDGRVATGGRPQARCGATAGRSHQAGGRGTAGSGTAAPGDKGKRPRTFVPQPSSSSSPSPPRQRSSVGGVKEGGRGGQSSGAESATEAAQGRRQRPKATGSAYAGSRP